MGLASCQPGRVWWLIPVIPALGSLREEDYQEFEANLGYIVKCIVLF